MGLASLYECVCVCFQSPPMSMNRQRPLIQLYNRLHKPQTTPPEERKRRSTWRRRRRRKGSRSKRGESVNVTMSTKCHKIVKNAQYNSTEAKVTSSKSLLCPFNHTNLPQTFNSRCQETYRGNKGRQRGPARFGRFKYRRRVLSDACGQRDKGDNKYIDAPVDRVGGGEGEGHWLTGIQANQLHPPPCDCVFASRD